MNVCLAFEWPLHNNINSPCITTSILPAKLFIMVELDLLDLVEALEMLNLRKCSQNLKKNLLKFIEITCTIIRRQSFAVLAYSLLTYKLQTYLSIISKHN